MNKLHGEISSQIAYHLSSYGVPNLPNDLMWVGCVMDQDQFAQYYERLGPKRDRAFFVVLQSDKKDAWCRHCGQPLHLCQEKIAKSLMDDKSQKAKMRRQVDRAEQELQERKEADCARAMKERIHMMNVQEQQVHAEVARQEQEFKDHHLGRNINLSYYHGERTETALSSAIRSVRHEGYKIERIKLSKEDWGQILDEQRQQVESLSKCSAIAEDDPYCKNQIIDIEVMRRTGTEMRFQGIPTTRGDSTKFFFGKPE